MNEDYLWDGSGPPDREIAQLEKALAPFRYRAGSLAPPQRPQKQWRWALAAAAAILLCAGSLRLLMRAPEPTAWEVDRAAGPALVGRKNAAAAMRIGRGDVMRTGAGAELALLADAVGRVELGPQSEARASSAMGLALERGTLHAFIWAPPRQFVVETPSSKTVDLGCEYTLQVDPSGDGMVRVEVGWVAFQFHQRESFIPAGAQCATWKTRGPGIPVYEDAPPALRSSLARFEAGDEAALAGILQAARPRDGLTLWHLLTRVRASSRGAVFARFAALEPLPAEVTQAAIERQDGHALDLCWDALQLQDTDWWRGWERRW